ncbi:hypothetical protein AD15_3169 [Escherichia coli 3-105-05_S4_C2]|uniref:hypothetical protein n=1 Tax=Escherichia coli TaxID=562 RepID=UPI0004D46719|nr:hypothetical protein [Escherichia coli]KDT43376.1 hypothetical protein AD15_3169 [Escherichia coli 3-105-05_S4_C2]HDX3818210.1 hypothetical protein [Escherichia coli]
MQKIFATTSDQYAHDGGEYHKTVLYISQSGGDVLIIGVYAYRTRYDDVLCGYTITCIWCDKSRYMTSHVVLVVITTF